MDGTFVYFPFLLEQNQNSHRPVTFAMYLRLILDIYSEFYRCDFAMKGNMSPVLFGHIINMLCNVEIYQLCYHYYLLELFQKLY